MAIFSGRTVLRLRKKEKAELEVEIAQLKKVARELLECFRDLDENDLLTNMKVRAPSNYRILTRWFIKKLPPPYISGNILEYIKDAEHSFVTHAKLVLRTLKKVETVEVLSRREIKRAIEISKIGSKLPRDENTLVYNELLEDANIQAHIRNKTYTLHVFFANCLDRFKIKIEEITEKYGPKLKSDVKIDMSGDLRSLSGDISDDSRVEMTHEFLLEVDIARQIVNRAIATINKIIEEIKSIVEEK